MYSYLLRTVDSFFKQVSVSDATGSRYTAQIHVRLNKSGAHIAVVRFLNHAAKINVSWALALREDVGSAHIH